MLSTGGPLCPFSGADRHVRYSETEGTVPQFGSYGSTTFNGVSLAGGATTAFTDLPFRSKELRTVNWIGFISNANEPSAFFLDQLSLTTTDPNR